MVNGKTLVGLTHDEAVVVLKGSQKLVQLVVATEHNEGDSVTSSLHSIPEELAKLATKFNSQQSDAESHTIAATWPEQVVGPEVFQPSLVNAFQQDNTLEMKNITELHEKPHKQVETRFMGTRNEAVREIEVVRSEGQPLGFSICGGYSQEGGIYVHTIDSNGPVGKDSRLCEGDRLLKVNGISLEKVTHQEALDILTVRTLSHFMFITDKYYSRV